MGTALTKQEKLDRTRQSLEACRVAPYEQIDLALVALKNGANRKMAAKAAGIPHETFEMMFDLGKDGHEVWTDIYIAIERADWLGAEGAQKKLQEDAENGDRSAYHELMKQKMPDEFGPVYEAPAREDDGTLSLPGGIKVQIAQFAPPLPPKEIEAGKVIEAEKTE